MKQIEYLDLYDSALAKDCITHTHLPFLKDYIALHILLKLAEPKSVMEIGTHIGEGTNIICNAVPKAKVHSLDLPLHESNKTQQHPILKGMKVGEICKRTYVQLFGDSMNFQYPECDAWFIDGEHDYTHPRHETSEAIKQKAKLIVWHDADIPEVFNAINDSFAYNSDYEVYRVTGTAIAYATLIEK